MRSASSKSWLIPSNRIDGRFPNRVQLEHYRNSRQDLCEGHLTPTIKRALRQARRVASDVKSRVANAPATFMSGDNYMKLSIPRSEDWGSQGCPKTGYLTSPTNSTLGQLAAEDDGK